MPKQIEVWKDNKSTIIHDTELSDYTGRGYTQQGGGLSSPGFVKNTEYNPNDPSIKRYIPSGAETIQPTATVARTASAPPANSLSVANIAAAQQTTTPTTPVTPPQVSQASNYYRIEGTNEVYDNNGNHITAEQAANIPDFWSQVEVRPAGAISPVGTVAPPATTPVAPVDTTGVSGTPEGITAVLGQGWQPADIFNQRGLVDKGILGAVKVAGSPDIFTIGPGGGWIESMDEYEKMFGTREQEGIVGEITAEQAKLLGIRPEGVAELKASRQKDKEMKELFDMAQKAGLSWEEAMSLVNSQYPVDTESIRDELGIKDVAGELFEPPYDAQEEYDADYKAGPLPEIKNKVQDIDDKIKKIDDDYARSTGQINENPWISEAGRVGKMRMLGDRVNMERESLLNQRKMLLGEYDLELDQLEKRTLIRSQQYAREKELKAEHFNWLLDEEERMVTEAREKKYSEGLLRHAPDWLEGRARDGVKDDDYDKLLSPTEAAALGVPYGTTRGQAAEQGLMSKEKLTGKDKIDMEVKLANNFERYVKEARQSVRGIDIIKTGYDEAINAVNSGGSLNAPSQAMLVTFQKMLDPTSVVRESEYARSGAGLSLKNQLLGKYEKLMRGGAGVTVSDLKEFRDISVNLSEIYEGEMLNYAKRIQTQANNYGLNIENILTPEILGELESMGMTSDNIFEDLWSEDSGGWFDFNGVGGDTNSALISIAGNKDGSKGGQCGSFVRKITGLRVGDTYASKMAKMDKSIKKAEPGMIFVMPYKSYGHIGIILSIKNGIATVKDSNWDLNEKIKTHKIPVSKMTGFAYVNRLA